MGHPPEGGHELSADVPPFVFVVGCGRSGTTVLRTALDAHPQLAVAHEAGFIYPMSRRRALYERPSGFARDVFVADLTRVKSVAGNLQLTEQDVRAALDGPPVVDYADATRRVFAWYAARRRKPRYGDKMPAYVQHIPALARLFPEAQFVHIIRDGRDVALSSLALEGTDGSVLSVARSWRSRVMAGRSGGGPLGPARYHEVRYEDLVNQPEVVLRRLCAFLGLEFATSMLNASEALAGVPAKVLANPRHQRLAEPLSPGRRSWRTDMADRDVDLFEAVAGDLLDGLGYERGRPSPSPGARARAAVGWAAYQARRVRLRLPGIARRTLARVRAG